LAFGGAPPPPPPGAPVSASSRESSDRRRVEGALPLPLPSSCVGSGCERTRGSRRAFSATTASSAACRSKRRSCVRVDVGRTDLAAEKATPADGALMILPLASANELRARPAPARVTAAAREKRASRARPRGAPRARPAAGR
jgi:hypothetical protein